MLNADFLGTLRHLGVIPVINPPELADVPALCEALRRGFVPAIEITFRASGAANVISMVREQAPDFLVGVGTVTSAEQATAAKAAGAQFAVAPGLNPEVAACAQELDLPFLPGVCTPSEIEHAIAMGLCLVKFFPAGALGGAGTVRAMLAPYLHLGLHVVPTGGIDAESAPSYWELAGVAAVGGTWIAPPPLVQARDWERITLRAKAATDRYLPYRPTSA